MAQPSSLNTNNPFRRKQAGAGASTPSNPPIPLASDAFANAFDPLPTSSSSSLDPSRPALPSSDDFRNSLQSLGQSTNEPPPKTSFQKPKVVKKVRVQSPPPSPESEEEDPVTYPPVEEDRTESSSSDDDDDVDGGEDPFARASETYPPIKPRQELPGSSLVPPNPFGRTLEDLEHPTNESTQSPSTAQSGGKGSLDVDSFRRLLLTGQAGGLVQQSSRTDGASMTDASSTLTGQDTPRTSHEVSEHEREESQSQRAPVRSTLQAPSSSRSKAPPPPPPSSRHGKLIKSESKTEGRPGGGTPDTPRPSSSSDRISRVLASPFSEQPSDVNKPLPAQPVRSPGEEDLESPFDREAAGKIPEEPSNAPTPRPPTPPKPTTTATPPPPSQAAPKKPPPPPRRSTHGRSESKVSVPGSSVSATPVATPQPSRLDEEPTRTSVDSIRSRSSSMKVASSTAHVNAPAPPPPRRSTHGSRPSTSTAGFGMGISSPAPATAGAAVGVGEGTEFPGLATQPISGSAQSSRPTTPANNNHNNAETASITSFGPGHGRTPSGSVGRLAPPPPPPARNKSVRSSGVPSTPGGTVRRTDSGRTKGEPTGLASPAPISTSSPNHAPPPPPRPRGSNRRSVSGSGSVGEPVVVAVAPGVVEAPKPVHPPPPVPGGLSAGAGARFLEASLTLAEEPRVIPDGVAIGNDTVDDEEDIIRRESAAKDILADLDALQREVDALRAAQEQGRV